MSSTSNLVRAEYRENSWTVINPDNGVALPVDQILMDVDSQGDGFAVGIVLSVHGLDSDVALLAPEQAVKRIKKLEIEMTKLARNLEFEQAARVRDEIQKLRASAFGLPSTRAG